MTTENNNTNSNNNDKQFEKPDFFKSSSVKLQKKKSLVLPISTLIIIVILSLIFAGYSETLNRAANRVKDAVGWDILRIDGNRNGNFVEFDHESHKKIAGEGKAGCMTCHHLSKPNDGPSSCYQCHSDMNNTVSIFDHNYHAKIYSTGESCSACHANTGSGNFAASCSKCHEDYYKDTGYYQSVRSYQSAMHTQCIDCHKNEDKKAGVEILSDCSTCHTD